MKDQKFTLSVFKNKRDTNPQMVEQSWQQLCSKFEKPQVRVPKDGALFSPAMFEPAYRKKENVCEVSMLVLDIDHEAELATLKTQIAALNSAFVIYSTHSHLRHTESNINAEPRFRVCRWQRQFRRKSFRHFGNTRNTKPAYRLMKARKTNHECFTFRQSPRSMRRMN